MDEEPAISNLSGNTLGLKASHRRALERTYRRRVSPAELVSSELARHLVEVSTEIGRQVGVLIGRDGSIRNVIVGDSTRLDLPDIGRLRGGLGRFRGLRLVHTHLRGEPLSADDLNDLVLLRLDAVAMLDASSGRPGRVEVALLAPEASTGSGSKPYRIVRARTLQALEMDFEGEVSATEAEAARVSARSRGAKDTERAIAIGVTTDAGRFEELLELVEAAGVEVAGRVRQRRSRIHPKTVVGAGKLEEIVLESMRGGATVAIFDIDLKPAQARAFEDATGLKAIDRTQLILDIFAQRARSRDGKLQVELAQLRYSLPRLTDKDAGLSRLTGGIGGRGPGETVMEIGRRRIRDRIRSLEKQVGKLSKQRDLRRRRRRAVLPVLSIIGYTNAGKSTLLNAMTESRVPVADRLFMTLDPTSRRLRFPREGEVILTDTVGFISDLPKDLLTAFRATVEELADADLLLHVVDASDEHMEEKKQAVERLLEKLDLAAIPRLVVLNKRDLIGEAAGATLARRLGGVPVSARSRTGLAELIDAAEARLARSDSAPASRTRAGSVVESF